MTHAGPQGMRRALGLAVLALLCSEQACSAGGLSGKPVAVNGKARQAMTLRVRLGEGFQDNTVSVRIDGKQVYDRSNVRTDLTISRADSFDVAVDGPSVQLEVAVQGGPTVRRAVEPAQTPFVEVRFIDGLLQLLPLPAEPPML
jgi:uncharacterized protein YcfJ